MDGSDSRFPTIESSSADLRKWFIVKDSCYNKTKKNPSIYNTVMSANGSPSSLTRHFRKVFSMNLINESKRIRWFHNPCLGVVVALGAIMSSGSNPNSRARPRFRIFQQMSVTLDLLGPKLTKNIQLFSLLGVGPKRGIF